MTSYVKSVMKCKKVSVYYKYFQCWVSCSITQKEMVVAIHASMYHVNSSTFALAIGAGQTGFLLAFHHKSWGKNFQRLSNIEMKSWIPLEKNFLLKTCG